MAAPPVYRNPPLAGRPPYATEDDGPFADPQPQRRYRQPPPPNPNARTSAYNHYDSYLNEKNPDHAYVAPPNQQYQQQSLPLAAPRPGYAAPIAALNVHKSLSPSPQPANRVPQTRAPPPAVLAIPPPQPISVPSTPHPLPPTMTPIRPVFARPEKSPSEVKFNTEPIMRGDGEGALLPRRGDKGDDFWRRFSMIAKEPSSHKESAWLRKTQSGTTRLSRWVWIVGVLLVACIGLSIGIGVYASKKDTDASDDGPKAIGGSAEHSMVANAATTDAGDAGVTTTPHVTPTHTVARRDIPVVHPTGAAVHVMYIPHTHKSRRRHNLNRSLDYLN